jgi:large subunit ribosomal protein L9
VKVILVEEVEHLGTVGDEVEVARGYARNYLLPQGLALKATAHNVRALEKKKRLFAEQTAKELEAAKLVAERLDGLVLEFVMKAGETGKLYGSVTNMDLAAALVAKGFDIDRKRILLKEPIKRLGRHEVPLRLHRDLTVPVTADVIKEGEPLEAAAQAMEAEPAVEAAAVEAEAAVEPEAGVEPETAPARD